MLTDRQFAFVNEYVVDFNGTQAAIRAGYSEVSAAAQAFQLLSNPKIYEAVEDRKAELAARVGLTVEWVLRRWKEIAEADPNELIAWGIECCRYCHGLNHEYQWNEFEYKHAVRNAEEHVCGTKCEQPCVKRIAPLPIGGFDFDPTLAPAANCPVCHGRGLERPIIADTRKLKGAARRLYAGIKQTQHGIEVKMRDQDAALKNIAQFLGMVITKNEQAGPGGGPIPLSIENIDPKDLSDDQLRKLILQHVRSSAKVADSV
jgi:phage terminase small subunit